MIHSFENLVKGLPSEDLLLRAKKILLRYWNSAEEAEVLKELMRQILLNEYPNFDEEELVETQKKKSMF